MLVYTNLVPVGHFARYHILEDHNVCTYSRLRVLFDNDYLCVNFVNGSRVRVVVSVSLNVLSTVSIIHSI
jgi:hypothetical protein